MSEINRGPEIAGLPEGSDWVDVNRVNDEAHLASEIQRLGLPEGSDWVDVNRVNGEAHLASEIQRLGLPEGSDWVDVNDAKHTKK